MCINRNALGTNKVAIAGQLPIYNHYTNYKDLVRYRSMSVLRLSIKASIGRFYIQRYLMVLPNGPKPIDQQILNTESEISELKIEPLDNCTSNGDHINSTNNGSIPPVVPVKCSVTNELFLNLAITGCLGLVPREQDHDALKTHRRQLRHDSEKSTEHCIVLIDTSSGSPLAVCVKKETSGSLAVRIYATRQMAFAQKPTATTHQLGLEWTDDVPLYAWAEVNPNGEFPDEIQFTVCVVRRLDGCFSSEPNYEAAIDGHATDHSGVVRSPVIKMVGRTDNERIMSGCALISMQVDETTSTSSKNDPDLFYNIHIAQGIDPALLICFTAIVDEILEKAMRLRYNHETKGLIRQDSFSLTRKRLEARSRVTPEKNDGCSCY